MTPIIRESAVAESNRNKLRDGSRTIITPDPPAAKEDPQATASIEAPVEAQAAPPELSEDEIFDKEPLETETKKKKKSKAH